MTTMKIKKQKVQKSVKFKSEDYINYLQASQFDSKINYLEKIKLM